MPKHSYRLAVAYWYADNAMSSMRCTDLALRCSLVKASQYCDTYKQEMASYRMQSAVRLSARLMAIVAPLVTRSLCPASACQDS